MRFQTVEELRAKKHGSAYHAPRGAWAGAATNSRSFLGGTVWRWIDKAGREMGESNAVPPNIYGETTQPGGEGRSGRVLLTPAEIEQVRVDSAAEIKRVSGG